METRRFFEVPGRRGQVELPIEVRNPDSGATRTVNATLLLNLGLTPYITIDLVRELFPSYSSLEVDDFATPYGGWWSPYVEIAVLGLPGEVAEQMTTYVRLCPTEGRSDLALDEGILSSIAEFEENASGVKLFHPNYWALSTSLQGHWERTVLVLGNDASADGVRRMRLVQSEVNKSSRRRGLVLRDVHDLEDQSLEEKLAMFAASSAMVLLEHTFPSGAIDELRIVTQLRKTTAILREVGHGATMMQADYAFDYPNVREFVYSMDPTSSGPPPLHEAVHEAIAWGHERLTAKSRHQHEVLPWRPAQRALREQMSPSPHTRYLLEGMKMIGAVVESALRGSRVATHARGGDIEPDGTIRAWIYSGSSPLEVEISTNLFAEPKFARAQFDLVVSTGKGESPLPLRVVDTSRSQVADGHPWAQFLGAFSELYVVNADALQPLSEALTGIVTANSEHSL